MLHTSHACASHAGSNLDSVIMDWKTLPGGPYSRYSMGLTLVHEMGHYFGLYHTFNRGVRYTLFYLCCAVLSYFMYVCMLLPVCIFA